jgi:energy-coupling factor transporter ATP-binding protein EcfA2
LIVLIFTFERRFLAALFDTLERYVNQNAAYHSIERQDEEASICQENTRETVLRKITEWAENENGHPVCWLVGPAGSGKSTIAHTIAGRYDKEENGQNSLAFSFFFSRRHHDRSDVTKLFPTFAYQLARALPLVQQPMLAALTKDPAIPHQRLELQFRKLIADHVLPIIRSVSPMIIVIDGLDECGSMGHVEELIQILVGALPKLPFRLLFTSRPEADLEAIFTNPSIINKITRISLRDFDALDDVYNYLCSGLEKVRRARNLPPPWPSTANLRALAEKSESIFIYASTLIKFVGDKYGQPQKRLQDALKVHKGLDSLFAQVLNDAQEYPSFSIVLGAVVVLQGSPCIGDLLQLLQLDSAEDIRFALRGCLSILLIPDSDDDYVRPYHTSLLDFLNDPSRRKDQFFDLVECQETIVIGCIKLITSHSECNAGSLTYAYRNWCHHLHRVLSCRNIVGQVQSNLEQGVTVVVGKLLQNFQVWMLILEDHINLERVQDDIQSAFNIVKVCLIEMHYAYLIYCTQEQQIPSESLIQGVEQILSNINVGVILFAIE